MADPIPLPDVTVEGTNPPDTSTGPSPGLGGTTPTPTPGTPAPVVIGAASSATFAGLSGGNPPHQGPRRHAHVKVIVDGQDVTDRMKPFLISVTVIDKMEAFGELDKCSIELDDRDAQIEIPAPGATVHVEIGWDTQGPRIPPVPTPAPDQSDQTITSATGKTYTVPGQELPFGGGFSRVFEGVITEIESGFSRRGGGRRLWIEASSGEVWKEGKQVGQSHMGVGQLADNTEGQGSESLQDFGGKVAQDGGYGGLTLGPSLQNIKRDYWYRNESPNHFFSRIANEIGGYFKIKDGQVMLLGPADLEQMGFIDIQAWWGINLIMWRIRPFAARAAYKDGLNKFFDIGAGKWDFIKSAIGGGGSAPFNMASATAQLPGQAPNRQVGEQNNEGINTSSTDRRGFGWLVINGEPLARAGGKVTIVGARPGVDGTYLMKEVQHIYSRRGYTTRIDVDRPQLDDSAFQGPGWKRQPAPTAPQAAPTNAPDVSIQTTRGEVVT
jgi:hypothetical protein